MELSLVSKAVDSSFNVQPERPEPYVNPRGTAVNHWYRVHVTLDPSMSAGKVSNPAAELSAKGLYSNMPTGGKFYVDYKEGGWADGKHANENPEQWHRLSNEKIDWNYYRNLKAKPWYAQAKIIEGAPDFEE